MAEGWLRHLSQGGIEALSAGTHPAGLNPLAVRVMAESGVDISAQTSDPLSAFVEDPPDLVIAVCSAAAASCPTFPGRTPMLSWPFDDPARARGSESEVLPVFRAVRDQVRARIAAWLEAGCPGLSVGSGS